MSYKVTGWVWEHATQTGSEKLTLLALADMCNHEGECYPGVERIAGMVGVTHRRMQQILRKLETEKVISIVYEEGLKTKTGHTNRYTLLGYVETQKEEGVKSTTSLGVKSTTSELSVVTTSLKDSTPSGVILPEPQETPSCRFCTHHSSIRQRCPVSSSTTCRYRQPITPGTSVGKRSNRRVLW